MSKPGPPPSRGDSEIEMHQSKIAAIEERRTDRTTAIEHPKAWPSPVQACPALGALQRASGERGARRSGAEA